MSAHICPKCKKSFNSGSSLAMHTDAKHPKGQILSPKNKKRVRNVLIAALLLVAVAVGVSFMPDKEEKAQSQATLAQDILSVKKDDWVYGNPNASVILIEYLDFECEVCGAYYPLMKQLKEEYGDSVLFVVRYYPLPGHPNSMTVAKSAEAAGQQGKFWEMHDKLFETQKSWGERKRDDDVFFGFAEDIGLDMTQFEKDFESSTTKNRVERDRTEGTIAGVAGTPSFFLNGQKLRNPRSIEDFKTLINAALLQAPIIQGEDLKVHEHADIKIYLNNVQFDLGQDRYQSDATNNTDEEEPHVHANESDSHFHDNNGNVAHKHKKGVTLKELFSPINITFNSTCFVTEKGERYCNSGSKTLKFYVNGQPNNSFEQYEIRDNDTILISYGAETPQQVQDQLASITDLACIYSETCPERGKPPTEGCVGGLGSDCT